MKTKSLDGSSLSSEQAFTQECLSATLQAGIDAIFKIMELRDQYTAGHQKRVASITRIIARKFGWPGDRMQALSMAAMVHDIGKMAVPSEILTKPSRLTDLEMQMVRGHVEASYHILKDIPFPWPVGEIVRQHHERLDGSGYPRGLKAQQISEEARVLAVADTLESMATHRPYRPAKGLDAAIEEIKAQAGIQLDVKIVEVTFQLLKDGNELQEIINSQ